MEQNNFANYTAYLLQHVADVLNKQSDQMLVERIGIGFSQVKILMVLQSNPNAKQKQIGDRLGQTEASISRQIKLLIKKSLISATVSPANRREKVANLTLKGERVLQEALNILSYQHRPVFEDLSAKQKQQLVDTLKQIHRKSCMSGRIGSCDHPLDF